MSLRSRIAIAIALTVAFYVLVIAVGAGLIAAPILGYVLLDTGNVWLAIAMIGAGIAVLRELAPERHAFVAPGPALTRERQPRLHALLDATAAAAGDRPPDRVHLTLDANAAVTEDGRARVLILGLPLLTALDEDELRAVVAHEHGHFVGGDVRAARTVWRTRATAIRAMLALGQSDRWFRANVAYWPFRAYTLLLLRITNAVSRQEEFAADALAARVTSPDAAGRALRRINGVAAAWDDFWGRDAAPMLEAGHRPPLAEGFAAMLAHAEVATALDAISAPDAIAGDPDPYASHPTLGGRLEALGVPLDGGMPEPAGSPAIRLLDDRDGLERELLRETFGAETDGLEAAAWDAASDVHLERMRQMAAAFADVWPEAAVGDAGQLATSLADTRAAVEERLDTDEPLDAAFLDGTALTALGCLVVVAAADARLALVAPPGVEIRVHAGEAELQPWGLLREIHEGERPAGVWRTHPVVATIAERPLGSALPVPGPAGA